MAALACRDMTLDRFEVIPGQDRALYPCGPGPGGQEGTPAVAKPPPLTE